MAVKKIAINLLRPWS